MRPTFFRSFILAPVFFLVGCGPGRLSDADVTRFCELTVRCSSGLLSQASCEASLETQRDAANRQGCGGQLGAVARCAIRADECATGVPESCRDEQMRLETCLERRMPDAGPGSPGRSDAGTGPTCTRAEVESDYASCSDGCDNDENGVFDCDDEACCGSISCEPGTLCGGGSCAPAAEIDFTYCADGCDNDRDGVFDCDDSGCCEALAGSCPSGRCASGPAEEVLARNSSGYLELYYMGEWRPVCDDSFDMADANVACRMLGYSTASSFRTVTGTTDLFWLDELRCTGSESSLVDCARSEWGVEDCSSTESVQVVCF